MARKTVARKTRSFEQQEAYHSEKLKQLQVRKQIAALRDSLKKKSK
jgi:hypothetical protein